MALVKKIKKVTVDEVLERRKQQEEAEKERVRAKRRAAYKAKQQRKLIALCIRMGKAWERKQVRESKKSG